MKTSFNLPSGDYNIVLSKDDLKELLEKGTITMRTSRTPCVTKRAIINNEKETLEFIGEKEIENCLLMNLNESVGDLEKGNWFIQFLNISVDKNKEEE